MDHQTAQAIALAVLWTIVVIVVRWALWRAYDRYEARLRVKAPEAAARQRTTVTLLIRVIVALIGTIGVWNVLSVYPATTDLARAMLASSAVLALFAGLAFSTPLSNLGSGLLVAFSQPLRLGDRVTVATHTGYVEDVSLLFTTLRTDDDRRIYVPNSQLTSGPIVNRTISDPRRLVTAVLPVRLDARLDDAIALLEAEARSIPGTIDDPRVLVTDVTATTTMLTVSAYTPLDGDVAAVESDVRAACLRVLGRAGMLPGTAT